MANVDNAASVMKLVGYKRKEAEHHINSLIESSLGACGYKHEVTYKEAINFDTKFVNLSGDFGDLTTLIEATQNYSSARSLLTGMPGTGKTALVNHVAEHLEMELITVRCSDILSKYIGESEQNIAKVFKQATESKAILFFDEVDSLLSSRESMSQTFEIQQVNELLTQMECFEFPLFAATNFAEKLDKAVLRRFDFKLNFEPLTSKQAIELFSQTIPNKQLSNKTTKAEIAKQLNQLSLLTPGDFAIIKRRSEFSATPIDYKKALAILTAENQRKQPAQSIGFLKAN